MLTSYLQIAWNVRVEKEPLHIKHFQPDNIAKALHMLRTDPHNSIISCVIRALTASRWDAIHNTSETAKIVIQAWMSTKLVVKGLRPMESESLQSNFQQYLVSKNASVSLNPLQTWMIQLPINSICLLRRRVGSRCTPWTDWVYLAAGVHENSYLGFSIRMHLIHIHVTAIGSGAVLRARLGHCTFWTCSN